MFIPNAFAQASGATTTASTLYQLAPIFLMFAAAYFMLIRPQQRKAKEHQSLLNNLRRGDRVSTTGGIIGTITKLINEQEIQLEIADDIRVRVLRQAISHVFAKTEPLTTGTTAILKTVESQADSTAAPSASNVTTLHSNNETVQEKKVTPMVKKKPAAKKTTKSATSPANKK